MASDAATAYGFDLGSFHRPVSTTSPVAQTWFDRGLVWCFGFNHEEAMRCFQRALAADPHCAMAHWGIAYALAPNYNKPIVGFIFSGEAQQAAVTQARAAIASAQASLATREHTSVEVGIINAVACLYPSPRPTRDLAGDKDEYAAALRTLYASHGSDLEVATLFAEALINRTPWRLWDLDTGDVAAGASTMEAVGVLERAIAAADSAGTPHPGLLHLYIHTMEMSRHPERALQAADQLRELVPDSGHLCHMPTHIDIQCGHYRDVVVGNQRAIVADRKYLALEGPVNFYSMYRFHDYHFKIYGAMFLGQVGPALEAADELIATLPEELLRNQGMAEWAEGFIPMKLHALIRFGQWAAIIAEPLPADRDLYCVTTAMLHYAKGVAYAATGDVPSALVQRGLFEVIGVELPGPAFVCTFFVTEEATARVPSSRTLFNNTCIDLLAIAREMLNGEIEYRRGAFDAAFAHLRTSVRLDDDLPFDEPWGWMQPTRHALGALLLEQGRVEEAEAVYRDDLGISGALRRPCVHPDNVWSLHGLYQCLQRTGKTAEAAVLRSRLDVAVARATVPIKASCLCAGMGSAAKVTP